VQPTEVQPTEVQPTEVQPTAIQLPNEVGQDDLVVIGLDGRSIFWVPKEVYEATRLPESLSAQISVLVGQGMVLADVPRFSLPGTGSACFLLNLASIRQPSTKSRK
jgi:hypothetical protein